MDGQVDTSDVLLNRGLNDYYYGGLHTREAYNGTVTNANILSNRQLNEDLIDGLQRQMTNQTNNNQFSQLREEISRNAMAAANCCCDTKLLIKDTTIEQLRADLQKCNIDQANANVIGTLERAIVAQTSALAAQQATQTQALISAIERVCGHPCPQ